MARLTITLDRKDPYALKLLAIHQNKRMMAIIDDAIKSYLETKGAYGLQIAENKTITEEHNDQPEQ